MKKFIALLLALVMVFAMSACSANEDITGTWAYDIDLKDYIMGQVPDMEEMKDYINIDSFDIRLLFVFNEDGTYSMKIDEEAFTATMDQFVANLKDGMMAYLDQELKNQGLNMSVEEALEMLGLNIDEEINADALMGMFGELDFAQGQYIVQDGVLYTSESLDEAPDVSYGVPCSRNGDTLTIEVDADDEGFVEFEGTPFEGMTALALTRVQ